MNLKEIPYDIKPVSLIKAGGEQHSNEYRDINPMEHVPALQIDGHTFVESLSIMHYLEETRPQRPLMPHDVVKRAKVFENYSLEDLGGDFALKCEKQFINIHLWHVYKCSMFLIVSVNNSSKDYQYLLFCTV